MHCFKDQVDWAWLRVGITPSRNKDNSKTKIRFIIKLIGERTCIKTANSLWSWSVHCLLIPLTVWNMSLEFGCRQSARLPGQFQILATAADRYKIGESLSVDRFVRGWSGQKQGWIYDRLIRVVVVKMLGVVLSCNFTAVFVRSGFNKCPNCM